MNSQSESIQSDSVVLVMGPAGQMSHGFADACVPRATNCKQLGPFENMPPVLPILKYKKRYDHHFHGGSITSLSFNSYGSVFAAGSLDGTVSIWAVDIANALHCINARSPIHSLVWPTGSEGFVFGCENGALVFIHLEEVCPFCY